MNTEFRKANELRDINARLRRALRELALTVAQLDGLSQKECPSGKAALRYLYTDDFLLSLGFNYATPPQEPEPSRSVPPRDDRDLLP